jgi:YHS domain-containing protein
MLGLLTRLLVFISTLWLIRYLLGALFGKGQIHRQAPRRGAAGEAETQRMVKDPVCGMYMDPRLAVRVDDREGDHYFCSEECRRKFLTDAASRR